MIELNGPRGFSLETLEYVVSETKNHYAPELPPVSCTMFGKPADFDGYRTTLTCVVGENMIWQNVDIPARELTFLDSPLKIVELVEVHIANAILAMKARAEEVKK